jgi:hypothetical protein
MHVRAKTMLLGAIVWGASWASFSAHALDLKQAYEKALRNDPQYQAARLDMLALAEAYPQALAQLLPNVGLNASRNSVNLTKVDNDVSTQLDYLSLNNSIVVRQALYRKPQFMQLQQAKAQQQSLVFIEEKAGADLVLRVTNAYFDALYAVDTFAQLQATLDAVEAMAQGHACDPLGRAHFARVLTGPWLASWVTGALSHTQGGLVTDGDGRVLDAQVQWITGVWAAGGCAAGLSGRGAEGYLPGNGLAQSFGLAWRMAQAMGPIAT